MSNRLAVPVLMRMLSQSSPLYWTPRAEHYISRSNSFGMPGSVPIAEYEKRKSVAGIISLLLIGKH
jgi:hypothetical protein